MLTEWRKHFSPSRQIIPSMLARTMLQTCVTNNYKWMFKRSFDDVPEGRQDGDTKWG